MNRTKYDQSGNRIEQEQNRTGIAYEKKQTKGP